MRMLHIGIWILSIILLGCTENKPIEPVKIENPSSATETDSAGNGDSQEKAVQCGNNQSVDNHQCLCGEQRMIPNDARFWTCVDEQWVCYRKTGCYVGNQKYAQNAVYRNDAAWCGTQKTPGGDYWCEYDPDKGQMAWRCNGACQCGDISVQIVDNQVVSGDMPFGTSHFICEEIEGKPMAGFYAVSGDSHENPECGGLFMSKGQSCIQDKLYCGDKPSFSSEHDYRCQDGRMICRSGKCRCGKGLYGRSTECLDDKAYCAGVLSPFDDWAGMVNGECTARGWVCQLSEGCRIGEKYYSAYSEMKDGQSWCSGLPVPGDPKDYICADNQWICRNHQGCVLPDGQACYAATDGKSCFNYQNIDNTTKYDIHYRLKLYHNSETASAIGTKLIVKSHESWHMTCKIGESCPCGSVRCHENMACDRGQCTCAGTAVADPQNQKCWIDEDYGVIASSEVMCGQKPCHGLCENNTCKKIEGNIVIASVVGNNSEFIWYNDHVGEQRVFCMGDAKCRQEYHDLNLDHPYEREIAWTVYANYYGWKDCYRKNSANIREFYHLYDDGMHGDVNLYARDEFETVISEEPEKYRCELRPSRENNADDEDDGENDVEYEETLKFVCHDKSCLCSGRTCAKNKICTADGCEDKNIDMKCGGYPVRGFAYCEHDVLMCKDPASGISYKMPADFKMLNKTEPNFICSNDGHGRRGWITNVAGSRCGDYHTDEKNSAYECRDEKAYCHGVIYPGEGFVCKDSLKWVCNDKAGCSDGTKTYPYQSVYADGKIQCGKITLDDAGNFHCEYDYALKGLFWICNDESGCMANGVSCPYQAAFDGNQCYCNAGVMTGSGTCDGKQWTCTQPDGCTCNGIQIPQGDVCYKDRFIDGIHIVNGKRDVSFANQHKKFACGEKMCPAYTQCYNGQCLFHGTNQQFADALEYKSVRGFPRCNKKEGCSCGTEQCRYDEFCRNDRCLKYPTYIICDSRTVPVNRIQATRHVLEDGTKYQDLEWESLFETPEPEPKSWYQTTHVLVQSDLKNKSKNSLYRFYFNYAGDKSQAYLCLNMPDPDHISEYELWIGTKKYLSWDNYYCEGDRDDESMSQEVCREREILVDKLDENGFDVAEFNPFVYDKTNPNYANLKKYIDIAERLSPPAFYEEGIIGWVCAKDEGCTCGNVHCNAGMMCVSQNSDYYCSLPTVYQSDDLNSHILRYPYAGVKYDDDSFYPQNKQPNDYHLYEICTDENGCVCGTQTCKKGGACVDRFQCRYRCEYADTPYSCIIPYQREMCPGADDVDEDGNCIVKQNKYQPGVYRFKHMLGGECAADFCKCGNETCVNGQWCLNGMCIN